MKDGKPFPDPTLSVQLIEFIDFANLASSLKKGAT
jgi:hypothetical protein